MKRIRLVLILATAAALCAVPGAFGQEEEQTEFDVPLKAEKLGRVVFCVYGEENLLTVGEPMTIAGHTVTVRKGPRGDELVWGKEGVEEKTTRLKDDTKPVTVTLGTGGETVKLLVQRDPFGRIYWSNRDALTGRFAGREVVFVDLNGDGDCLEIDVDGYGLLGGTHVVPIGSPFIVGTYAIDIVSRDGRKLKVEVESLGSRLNAESRLAYRALNDARLAYGLRPAELDEDVSLEFCKPHVEWMVTNQKVAHDEPPGSPGYSKDGDTGGKNSLVWARGGAMGIFGLLDTPLHGYEISSPAFTKTALWSNRYIAVWWTEGYGMRWSETDARWPAVFPPHGSRGVPISWWDEAPDPREGDPSEDWGYPIRVHMDDNGQCGAPYPKDFKAVLKAAGASSPEPVQIVSDPESVIGSNPSFVEVIVLPRRPLRKNKGYSLQMSWTRGGKAFEWKSVFKTCGQRGQFRGNVLFR